MCSSSNGEKSQIGAMEQLTMIDRIDILNQCVNLQIQSIESGYVRCVINRS